MSPKADGTGLKWLFAAAASVALFTGFGNMPLYGRYYIADIPGFGWSGDFIVNMKIHFAAGAALLGLAVYYLTGILVQRRGPSPRTTLIRVLEMTTLLVLFSGLLAGLKNFAILKPGLALNMTINFFHMGMAILLAVVGLASLVMRSKKTVR